MDAGDDSTFLMGTSGLEEGHRNRSLCSVVNTDFPGERVQGFSTRLSDAHEEEGEASTLEFEEILGQFLSSGFGNF